MHIRSPCLSPFVRSTYPRIRKNFPRVISLHAFINISFHFYFIPFKTSFHSYLINSICISSHLKLNSIFNLQKSGALAMNLIQAACIRAECLIWELHHPLQFQYVLYQLLAHLSTNLVVMGSNPHHNLSWLIWTPGQPSQTNCTVNSLLSGTTGTGRLLDNWIFQISACHSLNYHNVFQTHLNLICISIIMLHPIF